ncbi:unnamed protein product [Phytophthora lilii]|uniref:Unnamed protein product n=1 Tax=Phytophthora lilii TaxID=2077276 RepID=A0A9W6YDI3_9STRA|nr:unnamed protein product [Phytophthora lilii]
MGPLGSVGKLCFDDDFVVVLSSADVNPSVSTMWPWIDTSRQQSLCPSTRTAFIEGCRVLVLRTSNRSTQTGSIRTHADYATTDYATVDYATCGYKIVGTRWASTWRSLIG